jgi:phage-related protein
MAGIPKIKITFDADFDELRRGVKGATDEVEGFGSRAKKFGKVAGLAFAAAGAAAVAYAGKLAIDGVKAAIEDEAAQAKLATTLGNVTGATDKQVAAIESYITKTSLAFGITDDELRPSLDRLVRSTKDVEEAQRLQSLALDISAGSGKSLQSVSDALAKAHDGNFAALKKLGVPLDESITKSKDFDAATKALASTFENQASVQAETFQGKMARLKTAFGEAKETVGSWILSGLTPLVTMITEKVVPVIEKFINGIGGEKGLKGVFNEWVELGKTIFGPAIGAIGKAFDRVKDAVMENKDSFEKLWNFIKDYLAPFMGGVFKLAIDGLGIALGILIKVVAKVVDVFDTVFSAIKKAFDLLKQFVNFVSNNPVTRGIAGVFDGFRAAGGPVSAGSSYIVGERGPELFTPSSSGAIVPNNALGGGGINITVNGAIDAEGTARQIVQLLNRSQARGALGAGALTF